jgi:hypothetical protein
MRSHTACKRPQTTEGWLMKQATASKPTQDCEKRWRLETPLLQNGEVKRPDEGRRAES